MKKPTDPRSANIVADMDRALSSGKIDPDRTYQVRLPSGLVQSFTGRELIETAEATKQMALAVERGDHATVRACARILGLLP